jgi:hypothetical protein
MIGRQHFTQLFKEGIDTNLETIPLEGSFGGENPDAVTIENTMYVTEQLLIIELNTGDKFAINIEKLN